VGYRGCRQTGRRWHGYGKFTGPEEVADRIVLLAKTAGNVTGSNFVIGDRLITL
jgi:hypothetical protein